MKPYYEHGGITIYHGDCRDIMPRLQVDVMITDPPYGISHDADYSQRKGSRSVSDSAGHTYASIDGDDSSDLLIWALNLPINRIVWGANNQPRAIPTDDGGWLVWDKRVVATADPVLGSPIEIAWTNLKRIYRIYRIQHGGVINADGPTVKRHHPSQKPIALMRRCLGLLPSGAVIDPFVGTGTLLVAAKLHQRTAIGIDIEERYCEIAAERLRQEVLPLSPPSITEQLALRESLS